MSHVSRSFEAIYECFRPILRALSIDILDTLNAPMNSNELDIQTKRLTNMLETRFLDDSLIPADPDDLPGAQANATNSHVPEGVVMIPWNLLDSHGEGNVNEANSSLSGQYSNLPASLRSLDPEILNYLAQDESYVMYILNPDGSVNDAKLHALRQHISNQGGVGTYTQPGVYYNPVQPQFSSQYQQGNPTMQQYQHIQHPSANSHMHQLQSANVGGFSVPSINELSSSISGAYPSQPTPSAPEKVVPVKKKGAKGSVACRLFNTPQGCKFGDKCDFGHFQTGMNVSTFGGAQMQHQPSVWTMGPGSRRPLAPGARK